MNSWFLCKVKYDRNGDDGSITKVNESYLVDAMSFTEAEEKINEEMAPYISGEFLVSDIRRARIAELFANESGDKWYRCKINFVAFDEEKQVEKRTAVAMYAQATTLKEAIDVIDTGMKGTMADYEIHTVTETNIMDVFVHKLDS